MCARYIALCLASATSEERRVGAPISPTGTANATAVAIAARSHSRCAVLALTFGRLVRLRQSGCAWGGGGEGDKLAIDGGMGYTSSRTYYPIIYLTPQS